MPTIVWKANRTASPAAGWWRVRSRRPARSRSRRGGGVATGDAGSHGKRDTEADERDVHRQRERVHLARLEQVGLINWSKRGAGRCEDRVHHVLCNLWTL